MAIFWYILIAIVLALLAWFVISLLWGKPWSINLHYARTFLRFAFDSPELLTHLGNPGKAGAAWSQRQTGRCVHSPRDQAVPPDRQRPAHIAQL